MDTEIRVGRERLKFEKKILPPLLPGLEPETFRLRVRSCTTELFPFPVCINYQGRSKKAIHSKPKTFKIEQDTRKKIKLSWKESKSNNYKIKPNYIVKAKVSKN